MILESIRDLIVERLAGFEPSTDNIPGVGIYVGWYENFKDRSILCGIYINHDGSLIVVRPVVGQRVFEFADPAFPDNLLGILPVLDLTNKPPSATGSRLRSPSHKRRSNK